jgi:hypothetical protein
MTDSINHLLTDTIVFNAMQRMQYYSGFSPAITEESVRVMLAGAYEEMTRPIWNLAHASKRHADAYESTLRVIRANKCLNAGELADEALKGGMHVSPLDEVQRFRTALQAIIIQLDEVNGDPLLHNIAWNALHGGGEEA